MPLTIFKTTNSEPLNASEAFNIWNLLRERYISIETTQMLKNFIHDRDLVILVDTNLDDFHKQVKAYEDLARRYTLKLPERPPMNFRISQKIDDITDQFIYEVIYNDYLAELQGLSLGMRTSTSNDNLRQTLIKYLLGHLENFEDWYKFGKLKGWADVAPAFVTGKSKEKEELSVAEADHLWDHISTRYDQMYQTKFFYNFVHDIDLKLIIDKGIEILKKQLQTLEQEALKFEIPLPKRPPAVVESPIDPEVLEDAHIFRNIFTGMQSSLDLHLRAAIEATRNDKLRGLFLQLLKKEIDALDNYIKFGKLKGWTKVPPQYKSIS